MTTDEIKKLGEDVETSAKKLTSLLQTAMKNNIRISFQVTRPASNSEIEIESILVTKLSQSLEHKFEQDKEERTW